MDPPQIPSRASPRLTEPPNPLADRPAFRDPPHPLRAPPDPSCRPSRPRPGAPRPPARSPPTRYMLAAMAARSAALPPGPAPAALHRRSRRLRAGTAGSEPFGHLRSGFGHLRRGFGSHRKSSGTSGTASRAPPERVRAPPEPLGHFRSCSGTPGTSSAPPRALPERPRHFSARLRGSLSLTSSLSATPRLRLVSFRNALGEFRQNRKGLEGGGGRTPSALPGSGGDARARFPRREEAAGPQP